MYKVFSNEYNVAYSVCGMLNILCLSLKTLSNTYHRRINPIIETLCNVEHKTYKLL